MIPHYFLYEEAAPEVEPSFLHIEPIPVRSGRHNWTIRTHTHPDHHQILVISKGGGAIEVEGVSWEVAPPSLIIIPALTIHAIRFKAGTDGYVITVAPPFLQSALDDDADLVDGFRVPTRFLPQQIGRDIDLVGLFASLEHEFVWSAPRPPHSHQGLSATARRGRAPAAGTGAGPPDLQRPRGQHGDPLS